MVKKIVLILVSMFVFMNLGVSVGLAADTPINIAIIDTGISNTHGLLNMEQVLDGKNYVFENEETTDLIGHGTAIASLILGTVDGEIKAQVSENVNVVPLVFYSKYETGMVANGGIEALVLAIYDAVDVYDCQVINLSSGVIVDDENLRLAVEYAYEKGVIVISAVGNDALKNPETVYYPAAHESVVGVGAVDLATLEVADFSSRGESVFVLASAVNLTVAGIKNAAEYNEVSGSSYAVAYVSAVAAALLEQYPQMSVDEFWWILEHSAVDIGEVGYDLNSGFGVLDFETSFNVAYEFYNGLYVENALDIAKFAGVMFDKVYDFVIKLKYNNQGL